jgi:hypothetical protein
MNMRTVLIWLRSVGFCEQGNEHSDPLKVRDCIECVTDSSFLKSFFALWKYIFSHSVTVK